MLKPCLLSLVSVATLGIASLPAWADQANSLQTTEQTVAIVGDNNTVTQYSIQVNLQRKNQLKQLQRLGSGQQNSLQGVNQTAGVVGQGNQVWQTSQQLNGPKARFESEKPRHKLEKQQKNAAKKHFRGDGWEHD